MKMSGSVRGSSVLFNQSTSVTGRNIGALVGDSVAILMIHGILLTGIGISDYLFTAGCTGAGLILAEMGIAAVQDGQNSISQGVRMRRWYLPLGPSLRSLLRALGFVVNGYCGPM